MNEYSNSKLIMEEKKEIKPSGSIQELHILFKNCLDILRNDAEHLIGDEALNELSHFLILKQSEKHIINGTIDIYNLELYSEGINKYGKDRFVEYMEYVKFSKLIKYVKIPEKEVFSTSDLFDSLPLNALLLSLLHTTVTYEPTLTCAIWFISMSSLR